MLVVLALVAALVLGGLVALAVVPAAGLGVGLLLLTAGVVAQRADDGPRRAIGLTLLVALLLGGSYGAVVAVDVVQAITTSDGTPEPADPALLGSAEDKLTGLGDGEFRLELTEAELQAVIQDGIASDPEVPLRRLDLDLRGPTRDMAFTATFKAGNVSADGTATITADDGGVAVVLGPLRFGGIEVPGVARGAIEQLLTAVTDLNAALAEQGAVVQTVDIGPHTLIITGTRGGGAVSGGQLLDSIRDQAGGTGQAVAAPPEVLGPGRVDALEAPGEPMVLALGDSLAANVGVATPREGYVSRFHRAVSDRDGVPYGLANLGISGETSGSLLISGQLDAAEQALAQRPASYITIDIGANDLLGQLESPDCAADLTAAACQQRVAETIGVYRGNLEAALDRLVAASGGATVVFLQAYDPFSLGLGESSQADQSSAMLAQMNAVAVELADARGILVADGFTPMQRTTAATTHMLDPVPDIHPNGIGYDVLATALYRAVGG